MCARCHGAGVRELEAALAAKQALVEALHSKNCMLTILNSNLLMRDALGRSLALPPAAPPAALHLRISLPGAPASRWLLDRCTTRCQSLSPLMLVHHPMSKLNAHTCRQHVPLSALRCCTCASRCLVRRPAVLATRQMYYLLPVSMTPDAGS